MSGKTTRIATYYAQTLPPAGAATTIDLGIDPGPVNAPAVCEPASSFAQGQALVLIAASGGVNWGGANVFLSLDGMNYSQIGTLMPPLGCGVARPPVRLTVNQSLTRTSPGAEPGPEPDADCDAKRE